MAAKRGHGRRFRWAGKVAHSKCFRRIVGFKLTDRHRLETICEQCGPSSLELMARRRILQWMGHVLRMDEDRLPRQTFLGCTALQSGGAMRKVPVVAPLLWQDVIKILAPLEFKKPQQVGRMIWSCARRGGSG
eukprot:362520-Chlamydomonas_euryale.AAC.8